MGLTTHWLDNTLYVAHLYVENATNTHLKAIAIRISNIVMPYAADLDYRTMPNTYVRQEYQKDPQCQIYPDMLSTHRVLTTHEPDNMR